MATTTLITGASAGIGWAFSHRLAGDGHELVLVARDADRLAARAAEATAAGSPRVEVLVADLAQRTDLDRVAQRLAEPARPVDLLINNAGFGLNTPIGGSALADEERLLDVLCRAVLVTSHTAVTGMLARGHGGIINVSSVAGFAPLGSYAAAKGWVTAFSESLAHECRGTGVQVVAVCPGFTRTEFHDRAGLAMSWLPGWAWLQADQVVDVALADLRRGVAVSVPTRRYQLTVAALRHLPSGVRRRASTTLGRRRRP